MPEFAELSECVYGCDPAGVDEVLHKERLSLEDLGVLLSPEAGERLPAMAERSAGITAARFGRTIQIYAPLYLSSFCGNRCLYCGFSAENKIERRVLSLEEAEQEALILAGRGIDHLLLVAGEAPARMGVEYLANLAERLRGSFASLSIEVQPLSEDEYRRLFLAGITSVAVYQETYDRKVYEKVHLSGPKSDMAYRLATPARVAGAGMREVGIGALLGLADWRLEGLALGMHLAWLRHRFWRTALTVSFPRMRPAAGGFAPMVNVGERELAQLIFALRIFDPDVGLVLSTREEARLRDGMIGLGPTRYSAGSCTAPGGYSEPGRDGEQFAIGDLRTIDEVCSAIRERDFDPVLKDWDPVFQQMQGGEKVAA
ncbi:MAG: 2-iminoacetate synthase ThiH [Proteobacteria bacterium]|nr:2-iminoacetate synthase ThiH [Pseudomonadota bacterium]MBU1738312.1 2-iminoacetate synthase ThiH [Pseudomonadota bacterium]